MTGSTLIGAGTTPSARTSGLIGGADGPDHGPLDCARCSSSGSIEFGTCQVCLTAATDPAR